MSGKDECLLKDNIIFLYYEKEKGKEEEYL